MITGIKEAYEETWHDRKSLYGEEPKVWINPLPLNIIDQNDRHLLGRINHDSLMRVIIISFAITVLVGGLEHF